MSVNRTEWTHHRLIIVTDSEYGIVAREYGNNKHSWIINEATMSVQLNELLILNLREFYFTSLLMNDNYTLEEAQRRFY